MNELLIYKDNHIQKVRKEYAPTLVIPKVHIEDIEQVDNKRLLFHVREVWGLVEYKRRIGLYYQSVKHLTKQQVVNLIGIIASDLEVFYADV